MPSLLSINVGLPREVAWNGKRSELLSGKLRLRGGEWRASSISMVTRKPISHGLSDRTRN